jgi:hypothetical protein
VNLHTWWTKAVAQTDTLDVRFQNIMDKLDLIMTTIEDLIEDSVFMDNIHGEQELSLDLTLELFETIASQFDPEE